MNQFTVNIYTPESLMVSETAATALRVPGLDGDYGILSGRLPCVIALRAGEVRLDRAERSRRFRCGEGFLEMHGNTASLFVNTCEETTKEPIVWKR